MPHQNRTTKAAVTLSIKITWTLRGQIWKVSAQTDDKNVSLHANDLVSFSQSKEELVRWLSQIAPVYFPSKALHPPQLGTRAERANPKGREKFRFGRGTPGGG